MNAFVHFIVSGDPRKQDKLIHPAAYLNSALYVTEILKKHVTSKKHSVSIKA